MPMLDLAPRLREVGRIRLGDQTEIRGKRAPRRLPHFRFTADDRNLLAEIGRLYGGEVRPWPEAPAGEQWQVYSETDRLPVVIVPGVQAISQWWERWSGGGCERRCDGYTEQITKTSCLCAVDGERTCQPTTRLSLFLRELPGLGTWRLESHGYYASVELGGQLALIEQMAAAGQVVEATLRMTHRTVRRPGQPVQHFIVPALDVWARLSDLAAALPPSENGTPVDGSARAALAALPAEPPPEAALAVFPDAADLERSHEARIAKRADKKTPELPGSGRRRAVAPPVEPEPAPPPPEAPPQSPEPDEPGGLVTPAQMRRLMALCGDVGLDDRQDRLRVTESVVGRTMPSARDLTTAEASKLIDALGWVADGMAELEVDASGRAVAVSFRGPEPELFPEGH